MSVSKITEIKCRTIQGAFKLVIGTDLMNWKEPVLLEGPGSIRRLPGCVKAMGIKNLLIVTDKGLTGLHLLDGLYEELEKSEIKYTVFDEVQPNPSIENIESAKNAYLQNNCEAIIAFGGGSPMDCAKAAGARVTNPNISVRKMRGLFKVRKPLPPLFAVPTTAGTGSEVTLAAVVTDEETHEKCPINDPKLRPGYAVLDPELTLGLPPHITSTTGMDALTHAVEAYIGRSNVANTAEYAERAVKMVFENLEKAYADGKDVNARNNMLKASFCAGMAFTRAYVGYVHAIGHNLGGFYHIPHGLAMSVILPYVLEYYGSSCYERLAKLAEIAGLDTKGRSTSEKARLFIDEIKAMNKRMNIPEHLDGIKIEDVPTIAERAIKEGNPLYPVPKLMGYDECVDLIKKIGNLE